MAEYIYMTNPARIRSFLEKIQSAGVPDKLTQIQLKTLGFTSSNDRSLIGAMKNLGFISSSAEPTERWQVYRNRDVSSAVLAEAICEHYAELYKMYPDAHLKDNEALRNFFGGQTKVSANTLEFMIRTFKTLVELADFEASAPQTPTTSVAPAAADEPKVKVSPKAKSGVGITINIQLTLPEGSTAETFDAFFKAMREHLPLD